MKTAALPLPRWKEFEQAARRRRDPQKLLAKFILEYLEIDADQKLDKDIARQARRSSYREEDAVELVRQVRKSKRQGQTRGKA